MCRFRWCWRRYDNFDSRSSSIAKGDIEVTRVNSLVGKDGVPYLTQAHLDSFKKVSESVNRNMDTRMVEYDSGYTAGMVYVKYPSGVRGEIQIVGEKVLDIANAEHIPYDAFLGKPYAGAFPKENLGKASEILDPIRTAATSLDEVQKAKYLGYLNSQYTRARQIEQGASFTERKNLFESVQRVYDDVEVGNVPPLFQKLIR